MAYGPIDMYALEFKSDQLRGEILPELLELVQKEIVRVIDLVIVPGLGFDEHGNRLGRGRGFYDRFLAHPEFRGVSCALAFELQMTESVPSDALDIRVNMLVTDAKVRRFGKGA